MFLQTLMEKEHKIMVEDLNNLEEDLENAESVYDLIPTGYDTSESTAEFEYGGAE